MSFLRRLERIQIGILPFDPIYCYYAIIYGITRIFEAIYGTNGFWESVWHSIVDYFGTTDARFQVLVTTICSFILFWIIAFIFLTFDLTGSFKQYKTQPTKNKKLKPKEVIKAIFRSMINQLVFAFGLTALSYYLTLEILNLPPICDDIVTVPSFLIVMRDLIVTHQLFDTTFFLLHKLMHTPFIYQHIHKTHHEWKAPISVASVYAHPLEHMTTNFIPTVIGVMVMRSHMCTQWLWFTSAIISTVSDHSGYHFPFLKSSQFHDYHHAHFNECFGSCGVMDYIFGTDVNFRKSKEFAKHRVFFTPLMSSTASSSTIDDVNSKSKGL